MIDRVRLKNLQKFLKTNWYNRKKLVITIAMIAVLSAGGVYVGVRAVLGDKKQVSHSVHEEIPPALLKHLEKVTSGECKGMYKIVMPDQSRAKAREDLCTTGPDMAKSLGTDGPDVSGNYAVPCYTDGKSGKRIHAVYAVASDKPDRYEEVLPKIRTWAGYV
ncbi:MAG TPA: hypothetical protein VFK47_01390, partial [Ktedonobacteraceae bacterium]|nr:hypothetical protein [Ktedonobacteraceae bacterium]